MGELDIATKGDYNMMIGVAEYNLGNLKSGPYPGHASFPGISLYGSNGKVYRNGAHQTWGSAFSYGDRIGVLVEICDDLTYATITFFNDGEKIESSLDLKDYMSVDGGIVFTVTLEDEGDELRIIQDPIV